MKPAPRTEAARVANERNARQALWLQEAIAAQSKHYTRDERRPRFLKPDLCPRCGLSLLGTA